ncbi:MAG: Rab family GTPase [Promethearchaeota archaeon]
MAPLDYMFKICIFGDGGVGKTTLLNRFLTGLFKKSSQMTIGVDFHIKRVEINGKKVSLQIWDFAGENRFRFLLPSYMIGANGGIFMYDITRYSSIKNFKNWLEIVNKRSLEIPKRIPIIMVGGKLDLNERRSISREAALEIAESNGLNGYIECSSKTGEGVEEVFLMITRLVMKDAGFL